MYIHLPDILGGTPEGIETFCNLLPKNAAAFDSVTLDLSRVTWIRPYSALLLLLACQHLYQQTNIPVQFINVPLAIHAYLRRLDFFARAGAAVTNAESFPPEEDYSRVPSSTNTLAFFPLHHLSDVLDVVAHARRILEYWFPSTPDETDRIVSLLSEASGNVVTHSGTSGLAAIQKYAHTRYVEVELAIGDLGQGIQRSLQQALGHIAFTNAGYIKQALAGRSARPHERGGKGLGTIQRIATSSGGKVLIRSDHAAILCDSTGDQQLGRLTHIPGTQIAIIFRSSRCS
jgi:hypothetical protein